MQTRKRRISIGVQAVCPSDVSIPLRRRAWPSKRISPVSPTWLVNEWSTPIERCTRSVARKKTSNAQIYQTHRFRSIMKKLSLADKKLLFFFSVSPRNRYLFNNPFCLCPSKTFYFFSMRPGVAFTCAVVSLIDNDHNKIPNDKWGDDSFRTSLTLSITYMFSVPWLPMTHGREAWLAQRYAVVIQGDFYY